jgi:uncharacterized protein
MALFWQLEARDGQGALLQRSAALNVESIPERSPELAMQRIYWVLLLVASPLAHAVSFDCAKVTTPQEKAICSSKELSAADDQMAAAYKLLLTVAPPDSMADVRKEQREWIHEMAKECNGNSPSDGLTVCLGKYYEQRTQALRRMAAPKFIQNAMETSQRPPSDGTMKGGGKPVWHSLELTVSWEPYDQDAEPWPQQIPDGPDGGN